MNPEATYEALLNKLQDRSVAVREQVIEELVRIGLPVVPALVRRLQDRQEIVRTAAALALGRIGGPAVPALIEALGEEGQATRREYRQYEAARTLGRLGSAGGAAVPALLRLLNTEHTFVRQAALEALEKIGPGPEVLPALTGYLGHTFPAIRLAACGVLGRMGAAASAVVPDLVPVLADTDEAVRSAAENALVQIGAAAVSGLKQVVEDRVSAIRRAKEAALQQLPEVVLPSFFRELDLWDSTVRFKALRLLDRLAPGTVQEGTEEWQEGFREHLRRKYDQEVARLESDEGQYPAGFALHRPRNDSEPLRVHREQAVRDAVILTGDRRSSFEAVEAAVEEMAGQVVPRLLTLLQTDDRRARAGAIEALARYGPLARGALPGLEKVSRDPDEELAHIAALACSCIRSGRVIGFGPG
jgi:HEAT repeat protein